MTIDIDRSPLAIVNKGATFRPAPVTELCSSNIPPFEGYYPNTSQETGNNNIVPLLEYASIILIEPNTSADQLEDPLARAKNGLVLQPTEPRSSAELPSVLTKILTMLNNPHDSYSFYQWIDDEISAGRTPNKLLTILTTTTILLNSEQEQEGLVHASHIFSLKNGLQIMHDRLYEQILTQSPSANPDLLEDTRFAQLLLAVRFSSPLEDQSMSLMDAILAQVHKGNILYEDLPKSIVSYLKNAPRILTSVCETSAQYSKELQIAIQKEGKNTGILEASNEEQREACNQAIRSLEAGRLQDVKDINFSDKIPVGKKRIQIYYMPGTFGGMTEGHREGVNTMVEYIKTENERDPDTWRIILILPNLTPGLAKGGNHKDAAHVGHVNDRCASIALTLWDVDPDIVFISTQLPPADIPVKHGRERTKAALNTFGQKITTDFIDAGRAPIEEISYTKFCGTDKIYEETPDGGYILNHKNLKKFGRGTVILTRHGYLNQALQDAPQIVNEAGMTLIAKLSTHKESSTKALGEFHTSGDLTNFRDTARPLISARWSKQAIEGRQRTITDLSNVYSFTEIVSQLTIVYPQLIEDYFNG